MNVVLKVVGGKVVADLKAGDVVVAKVMATQEKATCVMQEVDLRAEGLGTGGVLNALEGLTEVLVTVECQVQDKGVTAKTLTTIMDELSEHGIWVRCDRSEIPSQIWSELTK